MRTSSLLRKLAAALLLGGGLALAGPVVSPQSIIVNPVQSSVQLRVWTGRDPSGLGDPGYLPGSPIHIFVNVSQPAYVYLFNVGPRGHIDLILPNRYSNGGNYLQPGTYEFPSGNDPFNFTVTTPYGLNRVLALASTVPLNLNQVYQFAGQSAFASVRVSGPLGLGQALSIVVSPVPQTSWVSDAVEYSVIPSYQVTPPPAPPPPCRLSLGSRCTWGSSVSSCRYTRRPTCWARARRLTAGTPASTPRPACERFTATSSTPWWQPASGSSGRTKTVARSALS